MEAFTTLTATAAPLEATNVDTDQVVPARFLKQSRKDGYGKFLFHDLRMAPDGTERPDFVLNRPAYKAARILVANSNFACGSSREAAVYALFDHGFRCVVAPSFGDIFFNNCFKNGLLPVQLPAAEVAQLRALVAAEPTLSITVDLASQTLTAGNHMKVSFAVDPFWKMCMLKGLDDISVTVEHRADVEAFEARSRAEQPWLVPPA